MSLSKCDNCGQEFPEEEIENHKMYCVFSIQQKELENLIPCEICNQLIDFSVYHQHLVQCTRVPILSNTNYPPLNSQKIYRNLKGMPISNYICRQGLWLPSSLDLKKTQILKICKLINQIA